MRRRYSFATVLVGKDNLRREGITRILRSANFRIIASVSCADGLPACKVQADSLLFLIVHTGDGSDAAIEQIELFRDRYPSARIAVLADHYRLSDLVSAFRAGATGYFVDIMSCDAFIKSIELVMMGETVLPPAFLTFALEAEADEPDKDELREERKDSIETAEDRIAGQLSPREISILRCLIEGDSNKCIARKIDIAEATVKVHIKAILRKIRVQNRTQAAIWGINNRSLGKQPGNGTLPSNAHAREPSPDAARDIAEIVHIADAVPLGVIKRHPDPIEVACADGHLRKEAGLKTNGVIRLRK